MSSLHIDIETYSSVDIQKCGAYKYLESLDFEILLIGYAFDNEQVKVIDIAQGSKIPNRFLDALQDKNIRKHAHNAVFERQAFNNFGLETPANEWYCSSVKAAYCGLPLSLDMVSKALGFSQDKSKLSIGKSLIRYFCMPCKPTKVNQQRHRNFPEHDLEKWSKFKNYCKQDVEVEREITKRLKNYKLTATERNLYVVDQHINDRGILVDANMASKAYDLDEQHSNKVKEKVKALTGLDNPNSIVQLKKWITEKTNKKIESLSKQEIPALLSQIKDEKVKEVLQLRQKLSKSSVKKYKAMINCICLDGKAHGLFQFYGANRTGRWAGRLIQLQNLPRNSIEDLNLAREIIKRNNLSAIELIYPDIPTVLSQLVRTTFIAHTGNVFAISDFSAIEARVIAWIAKEKWRIEVFQTHGKIYEASASMMFGVPIGQVTKTSVLRQKGKVAELALGYQGSVGALKKMGAEEMGLSDFEMITIIKKWRNANINIVMLWKNLEYCAKQAVRTKKPVKSKYGALVFDSDGFFMTVMLPSRRKLFYYKPELKNKTVKKDNGESFEVESLTYMGMEQTKKQWVRLDTYGGKLTENVVQAIARDILAESMLKLHKKNYRLVMHVHDEVVCEVPFQNANSYLRDMENTMIEPIEWAKGLPLAVEGYLTSYYKKD